MTPEEKKQLAFEQKIHSAKYFKAKHLAELVRQEKMAASIEKDKIEIKKMRARNTQVMQDTMRSALKGKNNDK